MTDPSAQAHILPCQKPPLTQQEAVSLLKAVRRDPEKALVSLYTIKNKQGKLQTLTLNNTQKIVHRLWERMRLRGLPIRITVLKYRQGGISTYIDGRLFLDTAFRKGITTWKVSHSEGSVANLFGMSRLAYNYLPAELRPSSQYSNKYELVFQKDRVKTGEDGLNSQVLTLPAKSVEGTRSFTVHNAHCSEVAFWPEGDKLYTALLSAIPNSPNTVVVSETTANGEGNFFYAQFTDLIKRANIDYHPKAIASGEAIAAAERYIDQMTPGQFLPIFLPWTLEPDCWLEPPPNFEPSKSEKELMNDYGLDIGQVFWRRTRVENDYRGREELFQQEFPLTVEEAFIRSGNPRFDLDVIRAMQRAIRNAGICPQRYHLGETSAELAFDMRREDRGELRIWAQPSRGESYVIGADTSEGVKDFHSAHVVRTRDLAVVAALHMQGSIKVFSRKLVWLANYFNRAFLGIEANSGGLYSAMFCSENYNNCYQRQVLDELEPTLSSKEGWKTTAITRPFMLSDLAEGFRDGTIMIPCYETLQEMSTFVKINDKYQASAGNYDDRVMSLAIAIQMAKQRPYTKPQPPEYYHKLRSVYYHNSSTGY